MILVASVRPSVRWETGRESFLYFFGPPKDQRWKNHQITHKGETNCDGTHGGKDVMIQGITEGDGRETGD